MASSTRAGDSREGEIRLWQEDDWWIARDVETGVTTQGGSREADLANLDDADYPDEWRDVLATVLSRLDERIGAFWNE